MKRLTGRKLSAVHPDSRRPRVRSRGTGRDSWATETPIRGGALLWWGSVAGRVSRIRLLFFRGRGFGLDLGPPNLRGLIWGFDLGVCCARLAVTFGRQVGPSLRQIWPVVATPRFKRDFLFKNEEPGLGKEKDLYEMRASAHLGGAHESEISSRAGWPTEMVRWPRLAVESSLGAGGILGAASRSKRRRRQKTVPETCSGQPEQEEPHSDR